MKNFKTFISTKEFLVGAFVAFSLTMVVFSIILTESFVPKSFLRQNNIYLDGKYWKLCKRKE